MSIQCFLDGFKFIFEIKIDLFIYQIGGVRSKFGFIKGQAMATVKFIGGHMVVPKGMVVVLFAICFLGADTIVR